MTQEKGGAMAFYTWKDSFNIGIEEIDKQHRSFLDCLNDCHVQVSGGKGAEIDSDLFDRLRDYAAKHFRFEEGLMQSNGYPEIDQQKKQHEYFESQLAELGAIQHGESGRTAESVLAFVRDWFLKHILDQDRKFVPYVK
jgi:hemerythrin